MFCTPFSFAETDSDRNKREVFDNPALILDLESEIADRSSSPDPPKRPTTASSSSTTVRNKYFPCFFGWVLKEIETAQFSFICAKRLCITNMVVDNNAEC